MKKYRVTVNGTAYEIELEELTGAAPAPAAAPAAAAAPAPAGGEQVTSPMPGTILDVKVCSGGQLEVPFDDRHRVRPSLPGHCEKV